jgi:lipoate-protein ligase B
MAGWSICGAPSLAERYEIPMPQDLTHYSGIVPCGISAAHFGVTSLRDLGLKVGMSEVDLALAREFEPIFGQVLPSP